MATISVDYDSSGDVELILREEASVDPTTPRRNSSSSEPVRKKARHYAVGCIDVKVKEFRLRVSSNKLISSSRYFKAMFEGSRFREAQELKKNGLTRIELLDSDDVPTAMMIILGILYSNDVQVPRSIDLQTLFDIATLVDKYNWNATVTPKAVSWFDQLRRSQGVPEEFEETLWMQLWITWVFGMAGNFKELSRAAQQYAVEPIDPGDVKIPLPSCILKAINDQRDTGFRILEQELAAFRKTMLEINFGDQLLKFMALGHATFFAQELELLEFAEPGHAGTSIWMVIDWIQNAQYLHNAGAYDKDGVRTQVKAGGVFDLEHKMRRAVDKLKMDKWGVECADHVL